MILQIPGILSEEELRTVRAELGRARFEDGSATAGPFAREVKNNLQLQPASDAARKCAAVVLEAVRRSAIFFSAALPLRVHGPVFNRYEPGMGYGEHVDNALMGTPNPVRTDVAATLFLSGLEEYEGGELAIQDSLGAHRVKLPAGSIVVYPGNSAHQVMPVGRGTRLAAVLWIQSVVRDAVQRRLLFELDLSVSRLRQKLPGSGESAAVAAVYQNLLRLWSET